MDKEQLQKRYTELKGKKPFAGWDEAELSQKISELETAPKDVFTAEQPKEKVYQLTESELRKIINGKEGERDIFTKDMTPVPEYAPKPRTYKCTVRLYQKDANSPVGVVTDLKTLRRDRDPETKKLNVDILQAEVTYDDGRKEWTPEFQIGEFYQIFTSKETCDIIKEDKKPMKQDYGMVYKTAVKKEGGIQTRMCGDKTTEQVPLRVRSTYSTYTVQRMDGKIYNITPKVINI
ncbi:MAG: hypothetical protein WC332_02790 [Clostridia bacterium]|jgi:hypothetical protein